MTDVEYTEQAVTDRCVQILISPLELQVAYKLYLGTRTDFEDAVHLYALFEDTLPTHELEQWVQKLHVEEYERLEQV